MAAYSGVLRLLEEFPRWNKLLVLNYHRIGNHEAAEFDEGVFSSTQEAFFSQVEYLQKKYTVCSLDDVLEFVSGDATASRRSLVHMTFDDGYLDNYTLAFPVLKDLRATATFFLPTAFIGTDAIPWWDRIAWILKKSPRQSFPWDGMGIVAIGTDKEKRSAIQMMLDAYKASSAERSARFISELAERCDVEMQAAATERVFMNWDEAREMQIGGMSMTSHTHSHELMSKLGYDAQLHELMTSRELLRAHVGEVKSVLAYPVGSESSYTGETYKALRDARFEAAFSFHGGINVSGSVDRYDIKRVGIEPSLHFHRFRFNVSSAVSLGVWL